MCFMHELEILVDDGFKKFPVGLQKSRILSDDVHDITGDDCLIILPSFIFAKAEKILNDGHEKAFLCFLVHCSRN